ncbi:MAG TPA: branched-chain amino acid ABC transporter permease [Dongiaceae bacterium]|nr:branched-chain amino acid ABC transporter permease [Dongiaceae bacterium]
MEGSHHRTLVLHGGVVALLFLLQFVLPPYHHTNFTSIMVLATYGIGYNILIGYTGLLSLGHAMFFAAGLYGAGLGVHYFGIDPVSAFVLGTAAGLALATAVGLIALRTAGVSFMIVTMMFAQACYLLVLYFNDVTRGDEGIVLREAARQIGGLSLVNPTVRFNLALALLAGALILCLVLVRSRVGRVLVAIRENEDRVKMLGYHTFHYKLLALALSGLLAGAAGAAYALMFGYVGATFASIEYSIYALLWVLLGGSGTVLGPLIGALLMFYLVEWASDVTESYRIVVGVVLVLLTLFFPKGILGTLRERRLTWLP